MWQPLVIAAALAVFPSETSDSRALPNGAIRRLGAAPFFERVGLWSVACSPDSRQFATAAWDRSIADWDVVTGERLADFRGHDERGAGLAFSPDGTVLPSGGDDGTILLWKVPARRR